MYLGCLIMLMGCVIFFCYTYNEGNFCASKLEDRVLWPGEKEGKSGWVQVQLLAVAMGNLGELSTTCLEHLWDDWVGMGWEGADNLDNNFHTFGKVCWWEWWGYWWKFIGRITEMYTGRYKIISWTIGILKYFLNQGQTIFFSLL